MSTNRTATGGDSPVPVPISPIPATQATPTHPPFNDKANDDDGDSTMRKWNRQSGGGSYWSSILRLNQAELTVPLVAVIIITVTVFILCIGWSMPRKLDPAKFHEPLKQLSAQVMELDHILATRVLPEVRHKEARKKGIDEILAAQDALEQQEDDKANTKKEKPVKSKKKTPAKRLTLTDLKHSVDSQMASERSYRKEIVDDLTSAIAKINNNAIINGPPIGGYQDQPMELVDDHPGGPYVPPPDPIDAMTRDGSEDPLSPDEVNLKRRESVVDAFMHAWDGYEKYAWGQDELQPRSKTGKNWNDDPQGTMALTICDAITTLHFMGKHEIVEKAIKHIKKLNFNADTSVSQFETTIRVLGSILSIYELTGEKDQDLLNKAVQIADRLLWAYNTTSGIPHQTVNLKTHRHFNADWTGGASVLSELGTVQLELRTLSYHTKNPTYDIHATHQMSIIEARAPKDMLCPVYTSVLSANWMTDHISMGALGDSFYEYLLKQYLLTGKTEDKYKAMYQTAAEAIVKKLIFHSQPGKWAYIAEHRRMDFYHKMDHLACFVGGMLALGAQQIPNWRLKAKMMKDAEDLTHTCYLMYKRQKSGLSPEYVEFPGGQDFVNGQGYYILRPETMESLFYMWRFTKDQKYRDWGWEIFRAIVRWGKVESGGFSGVREVNVNKPIQDNLQQSFFLAETMKYTYLLFCDDDAINFDEWVFNTEAHPLKIRKRDPLDIWRQFEEENGSVNYRPPKVKGVREVETEKMTADRLEGKDRKVRGGRDRYSEELDGAIDDEGMPFDPKLGMEGIHRSHPNQGQYMNLRPQGKVQQPWEPAPEGSNPTMAPPPTAPSSPQEEGADVAFSTPKPAAPKKAAPPKPPAGDAERKAALQKAMEARKKELAEEGNKEEDNDE